MKKKSVAKNYIYNLIYQLLTIITPLITTPYVCRVLGVLNNGIYGYTFSIVTYFVLFGSLGTGMYGQREIAYVQDDKKKQTSLFIEVMLIKVLAYVVTITFFYLFFCTRGDYAIFYKILIIELLANLLDISWFFQGNEDFAKTVIRNIIVKVLGLILIFTFVKTKNDLWKFFLILTLSDFLGNLSLWLYLPKCLVKKVNKIKLKKHIKPIIALFIPQIAIQIYAVIDKTMIGNILNDMAEVAYYDQAQKVVRALLLIVTAMGAVMSSKVAFSYAKKKYSEIKEYLIQSTKMVWLIATPIIFGIFATSNQLVPIYFGAGYEPVIPILNLTSFILLIIGLNNITGIQYLIQTNNQKMFTISVSLAALINVILNFILINIFGTIGAVFASLIAEIFVLLFQLRVAKDAISIKKIFASSRNYVISGLIMYVVIFVISKFLGTSIFVLGLKVIIGAVVYICCLVLLKDKFTLDLFNQVKTFIKTKVKS